jgi:hypothetical protein
MSENEIEKDFIEWARRYGWFTESPSEDTLRRAFQDVWSQAFGEGYDTGYDTGRYGRS